MNSISTGISMSIIIFISEIALLDPCHHNSSITKGYAIDAKGLYKLYKMLKKNSASSLNTEDFLLNKVNSTIKYIKSQLNLRFMKFNASPIFLHLHNLMISIPDCWG